MEENGILSRLKDRLGANGPGVTIGVIALVVALTGGAYAASGGLTGKQKKETEKIAKKVAGKPGAAGPTGPQGPAGAKGDSGAAGAAGEGAAGKDGEKGEKGEKGNEGSPWTAGGTLPPGATETGTWGGNGTGAEVGIPISFAIPLAGEISSAHTHFQGKADFAGACQGSLGGSLKEPKAKPGELCVYTGEQNATLTSILTPNFGTEEGAGKSGAVLNFNMPSGGYAFGSYAVTGCTAEVGKPATCP